MTSAANSVRHAASIAAMLLLGSTAASAQGAPPETIPVPGAATTVFPPGAAGVVWTPAQPRQGSIVRITLRPRPPVAGMATDSMRARAARQDSTLPDSSRPASTRADSTRADSTRQGSTPRDSTRSDSTRTRPVTDSLPSVTVALGVRVDSLRAVLDTLPLRAAADSARTTPDTAVMIRATLFGEPLHFEREPGGDYTALAAIPVDAPASVKVSVIVARGTATDTIATRLAIRRTAYKMEKMEKLTVAPRFGQAPDSALAARIAREQAMAAAVSRKSHETPRLWEGQFQRPRTARVTSGFGDGREFNGKVQSRHMGLDLAGATGTPVAATNRGVVALVGDFYYAGKAVYIDHGAGLVTAYFHLSAVNVAQGDTVTPGMRIGSVGATGRVTGPHLHWVARYGAVSVDPSTLLEVVPAESQPAAVPGTAPARDSTRASVPLTPPHRRPQVGTSHAFMVRRLIVEETR